MKKTILSIIIAFSILGCNNSSKKDNSDTTLTDSLSKNKIPASSESKNMNSDFDLNNIKESTADLGEFPYLNPPESYNYNHNKIINKQDINDFDKEYFAVAGKLIPVEGKSFKSTIEKDRSDGKRFNSLIVGKSYENAILALGGVLVNNITIPQSEIKRVGDKELIEKHYGFSLDYNLLDDIKTYIIKTKDKEIWIQFYLLNDESGGITILEKLV